MLAENRSLNSNCWWIRSGLNHSPEQQFCSTRTTQFIEDSSLYRLLERSVKATSSDATPKTLRYSKYFNFKNSHCDPFALNPAMNCFGILTAHVSKQQVHVMVNRSARCCVRFLYLRSVSRKQATNRNCPPCRKSQEYLSDHSFGITSRSFEQLSLSTDPDTRD
jgi:hypothetical protein